MEAKHYRAFTGKYWMHVDAGSRERKEDEYGTSQNCKRATLSAFHLPFIRCIV